MAQIVQPDLILTKDGVEISRHRDVVYAMNRAEKEGAGTYLLKRPDATITVEALNCVIPDPVKPEPEPEPEAPAVGKPADIVRTVDESRLLNFEYWHQTDRYTRASRLTVWSGDTVRIDFDCQDLTTTGGGKRHHLVGTYQLLIDGKTVQTLQLDQVDLPANKRFGRFEIDISGLDAGWHIIDMLSSDPRDTPVPYPVFVLRGELSVQDRVPVFTGSHEIDDTFHIKWVPTEHKPRLWDLAPRIAREYSHIPKPEDTHIEMVTGAVAGHVRRLSVSKDGIFSTATKHDYFWSDLIAKYPIVELMDGPRGANCVTMLTHISIGTGRLHDRPDSPLMGNTYATTPWSLVRIKPDGSVQTLAGFRHKGTPSYWEDPAVVELVGDWSNIEEDRRRFHELWGFCWLPQTTLVDHSAPSIYDSGTMRQPHITAPVGLLADSQMDAIRSVTFSATQHDVPPTVREWYRGDPGADVWDCVTWGDCVLASERGKHRIIMLDADGQYVRTVVQGEALCTVDRHRNVQAQGTLAERRAAPCVAPEGLYVLGDWLYFGDSAQAQVRRVHLLTGELDVVVPHLTGKLQFVKVAVSDGSTGPRGTVFVSLWNVGSPSVFTPDGKKWALTPYAKNGVDRGRAKSYSSTSYSTAIGCGHGRIEFGSAMEGLRRMTLAEDSDLLINQVLYAKGRDEWRASGYYLSHGPFGESFFGLPLPWGESTDMDYYLTSLGHE